MLTDSGMFKTDTQLSQAKGSWKYVIHVTCTFTYTHFHIFIYTCTCTFVFAMYTVHVHVNLQLYNTLRVVNQSYPSSN